ncbi:infB [Symbiodinium sp. CCMP2592]|nr:infB [Symbiodinium sp. CCMP2592]
MTVESSLKTSPIYIEARLREAATELASLQEAVRRLQHQRQEAALRKEALQRAVEEERPRCTI